MADVTLKYKGATIAELSESGNKNIETAGKYCEDDILLEYVKSEGGGSVSVASGEVVLSSDLSNANHYIAHNLGVVPDVIKWWIDTQSIPNINCLAAGYFTRTVAPNVKFPTTGVSNYLCGIWHSSTQNTNNYQQWDYTIRSPYINSVSKTGFNICATEYVIPANYTIKWIAYAFNE